MYWAVEVAVKCEQCKKTAKYGNPGQHAMQVVAYKAMKDGWFLPLNGKHICPECRKALGDQAGLPEQWHGQETLKHIEEIEKLPDPPRLI